MKLAWKLLVGVGAVLILIAFNLDTTVAAGPGTRVHNMGLQARQQMILVVGCAAFLAGIILFGIKKLKQTGDDEKREAEASQAALKKLQEEAANRLAAGEKAYANVLRGIRPGTDYWFGRLVAGIFVGYMWSGIASVAIGYGGLFAIAAVVYSFWKGRAVVVLGRLLLANALVLWILFAALMAFTGQTLSELWNDDGTRANLVMLHVVAVLSLGASLVMRLKRRP